MQQIIKQVRYTDPLNRLSSYYNKIVAPTLMLQLYDGKPWEFEPENDGLRRPTTTKGLDKDLAWSRPSPSLNSLFEKQPEVKIVKLDKEIKLNHWQNPIDYDDRRHGFEWRLPPLAKDPYSPSPTRLPTIYAVTLEMKAPSGGDGKNSIPNIRHLLYTLTGIIPQVSKSSNQVQILHKDHKVGFSCRLEYTRMWIFVEQWIECVLPRLREWEGFEVGQDWLTSPEEIVGDFKCTIPGSAVGLMPQIEPYFDKFPKLFDLNITFHTTSRTRLETLLLISSLGIPLTKTLEKQRVESNINRIMAVKEDRASAEERFAKFRSKKRNRAVRGARLGIQKEENVPTIIY